MEWKNYKILGLKQQIFNPPARKEQTLWNTSTASEWAVSAAGSVTDAVRQVQSPIVR